MMVFSSVSPKEWFSIGIFRVLRRMHCNPIFAPLAIARLAEVSWDAIGVESFPFKYEQSKLICIPAAPRVSHKCADGMEVTQSGHDEIRQV